MEAQSIPNSEANWFERHPKRSLAIVIFILLLGFEGITRLLAYFGTFPIRLYSTGGISERFMGDIDPHFGVWHYPNRTVQHSSPCFDVTNTSNSYGARDRDRSRRSDAARRVVVLGDSYVEGFGVAAEERMTEIAEKNTGIELLNFGVSGNFSSTQSWLLYRELASQFDHSDIFLFLLPDNDFEENDPANFSKRRYRPYLRKNSENQFEVFYPVAFEDREQPEPMGLLPRFRRTLYNNIYLLNIIRQLSDNRPGTVLQTVKASRSGYSSFQEIDLERLFFGYEQIISLAGQRQVSIFVIPREEDLRSFAASGGRSPLIKRLEQFATRFPNLIVHDLAPDFAAFGIEKGIEFSRFYLSCDGHWSTLGNSVAADILVRVLSRRTAVEKM